MSETDELFTGDGFDDDDWDGEIEEPVTCDECNGEGIIITCCDDICVGSGHCIHGDGEEICPVCHGEGSL